MPSNASAASRACARRGGGGVNDVVVQQLALPVEADNFAAGAEARVDGQHVLASQRRGQQQLAKVFREHADGFDVRTFLGLNPHLHFNRLPEQALVAVLHREAHLLGGGPSAGDKEGFDQAQSLLLRRLDAHHEQPLAFAAANGQHPMAGDFGERLTPIEVVLELRGRLLLFERNLRFHHRLAPEQRAQLGASLGIVADALGQDVASPRQGAGRHRGRPFQR